MWDVKIRLRHLIDSSLPDIFWEKSQIQLEPVKHVWSYDACLMISSFGAQTSQNSYFCHLISWIRFKIVNVVLRVFKMVNVVLRVKCTLTWRLITDKWDHWFLMKNGIYVFFHDMVSSMMEFYLNWRRIYLIELI